MRRRGKRRLEYGVISTELDGGLSVVGIGKSLIPSTLVLAACAMFTSTCRGELFSVQFLENGTSNGVSFSWLHYGGTNGSGVTDFWRIGGHVLVDYSATGGNDDASGPLLQLVTTDPASDNVIDISDSGVKIGEISVTDFRLWNPFDDDGGALGYIDFTLSALPAAPQNFKDQVATASNVRVDFLDMNLGGSSNGFNGFHVDGSDNLRIRLWGDEEQVGGASSVNWGMDWASTGTTTTVVPAPGAVALALVGFSFVGCIRRRTRR